MTKIKLIVAVLLFSMTLLIGCGNSNTQVDTEQEIIEEVAEAEEEIIKVDRNDPFLIFVNKENPLPDGFIPENLASIDGKLSSNQGISVDKTALEKYLRMREDALEEGAQIIICSAYRSYDLQSIIYNRYLSTHGEEWTKAHSAYPGTSEHQTGLAMDITSAQMVYGLEKSFENTKEGIWLKENCARYGFIIRYPDGKEEITGYSYEPWHIRYIGEEYAKIIMDEEITLEEFFNEVSEE